MKQRSHLGFIKPIIVRVVRFEVELRINAGIDFPYACQFLKISNSCWLDLNFEWEKNQIGRGSSNLKLMIGEINFTYESIDNSKLEEG